MKNVLAIALFVFLAFQVRGQQTKSFVYPRQSNNPYLMLQKDKRTKSLNQPFDSIISKFNSRIKIISLPQDNMPCIKPVLTLENMPNVAKTESYKLIMKERYGSKAIVNFPVSNHHFFK